MLHILKTIDPHFTHQWDGKKTFEVRRADRRYAEGDYILSRQYDANYDCYSGRQILLKVPHFLSSSQSLREIIQGLEHAEPFVIMSTQMIWALSLDPAMGAAVGTARQTIDELEGVSQ